MRGRTFNIRYTLRTLLCMLLLCFAFRGAAQVLTATVDRDKILIGEQIVLQVRLEQPDGSRMEPTSWFTLPDSFAHFEVIKRLPIDTIHVGSPTAYVQKIILTSFDSGSWTLPPIRVAIGNREINTQPLTIAVLPVDVSGLKEYHDIKGIIQPEESTNWWRIAAIAGGVLLVLAFGWWLVRYLRRKKKISLLAVTPLGWQEAITRIDALEHALRTGEKGYRAFFTELVQICRHFSDSQLRMNTTSYTTDEYMLAIRGRTGAQPAETAYFQLLRISDAVKFAKFIPTDEDCAGSAASARAFIQAIHHFQFQPKSV